MTARGWVLGLLAGSILTMFFYGLLPAAGFWVLSWLTARTGLNWLAITMLGVAVLGWMRAGYWKGKANGLMHDTHTWHHAWPDGPNPNRRMYGRDPDNCVWCLDPDRPRHWGGQFPRKPLMWWVGLADAPLHCEKRADGTLHWVKAGQEPREGKRRKAVAVLRRLLSGPHYASFSPLTDRDDIHDPVPPEQNRVQNRHVDPPREGPAER